MTTGRVMDSEQVCPSRCRHKFRPHRPQLCTAVETTVSDIQLRRLNCRRERLRYRTRDPVATRASETANRHVRRDDGGANYSLAFTQDRSIISLLG